MLDTQRYRVNYRLLASLVIGGFITAVSLYGLWWFQVNRNASRLLARAQAAEEKGDEQEAYDSLNTYVKLRPDENDARIRLGNAASKLSEREDIDMPTRGEAYLALIDATLRTDDPGLKRKLVDWHMRYGYNDRALQAIEELLAAGKGDSDLKALKAQCLFANQRAAEASNYCLKLIGYDRKAEKFDPKAAEATDKPLVYFLAAQYLNGNRQADLAKKVADQMVAVNPKSREAYVLQYQFLKGTDRDAARAALDKAYQLEPDNDAVLLAKGVEELQDYQELMEGAADDAATNPAAPGDQKPAGAKPDPKLAQQHLDTAAKYFATGRAKHPDRMVFFENAARVELASDRIPEALKIIDDGLKQFDLKTKLNAGGIPLAIELENFKIELMLGKNDVAAAKAEIKMLRELHNTKIDPIADYHDARIELQKQNWLEAARRLEDIKTRLINFPNLQAMAGATQAVCYSQLGQYDVALDAYEWALEKNPNLPQAKIGRDQMKSYLQKTSMQSDSRSFDAVIQEVLALPKEQQNWDQVLQKVDEMVASQAQLRQLPEARVAAQKQLMRAQVFATRALATEDEAQRTQLFGEAKKAIKDAFNLNPSDPAVQIAAPRLIAMDPKGGPAEALKLLDKTVASQKKDSLAFKLLRIDLLTALHGDQFTNQLYKVTEGMSDWPAGEQAQVWSAVGSRFEQMNQLPDAQTCMSRAIELAPNILQFRLALFELARKQGDDASMRAAQEKVLELVTSKTDPTYLLTEVQRMMYAFANQSITEEQLKPARAMLDQALKQRPTWAELHLASGQLWLILEKNTAQALKSFDKALESGPANYGALNLQVRLLAEMGRFQEARQRMDRAPRTSWPTLFERVGADVLRNMGQTQDAYLEAKKYVDLHQGDPEAQSWFADIANAAQKYDDAEAAMKKAIDLNPINPDSWSSLLGFYMLQKKGEQVEQTLREAQLALDEEFLPLLMAKQHELFRRWPQAEAILLAYYGDKLDEPGVARRMAEFYLTWAQADEANRGKATVYLNKLLRAANEGKLPPDDEQVIWARRQSAGILARKNDYQASLRAERLLDAAIAGKAATAADKSQLIDILLLRGDPASRDRAIALMREMQQAGSLTAEGDMRLGQALMDTGNWPSARTQMQDAISRHPDDATLRIRFVKMLIDQKDFGTAERWIARLDDSSAAGSALEMRLRLAAARGQKDLVTEQLAKMTPDLRGALTATQLKNLEIVSNVAESVGQHDYALKLMREFVRRSPGNGNEVKLAGLISLYAPLDEAISYLKQIFDGHVDDTVNIAVDMLRARRAEAPQRLDEEVDRIVRQARRDDPESARRMVMEAQVYEIQEKYDEAIAAYDKLLSRDDAPLLIRATALNNLAFLLTLKKVDLDKALKLANEAVDVVGPISDILDTRGIVYHAKGDLPKAVEDLKLSVTSGPTASKYFHLATAQWAAGDKKGALDTWAKAKIAGISPEKVSKLEWDELKEFTKQADAVGSSTAQQ